MNNLSTLHIPPIPFQQVPLIVSTFKGSLFSCSKSNAISNVFNPFLAVIQTINVMGIIQMRILLTIAITKHSQLFQCFLFTSIINDNIRSSPRL